MGSTREYKLLYNKVCFAALSAKSAYPTESMKHIYNILCNIIKVYENIKFNKSVNF